MSTPASRQQSQITTAEAEVRRIASQLRGINLTASRDKWEQVLDELAVAGERLKEARRRAEGTP